ncbi:MAG: SCP2 sterol-binding domain-containing protein [Methanobacteriota archaeon]|nr:MAG: SCP2 sterol-binding domain-containing protein [Euryarchaeota archaeon]
MAEELLREAIDRFNAKVAENHELAKELEGVSKLIQVELEGDDWYHFKLENGAVNALNKGGVENPDIRIITSADTLRRLWSRELRVMKALVTKKLQVKGSMEDLLRLKQFF